MQPSPSLSLIKSCHLDTAFGRCSSQQVILLVVTSHCRCTSPATATSLLIHWRLAPHVLFSDLLAVEILALVVYFWDHGCRLLGFETRSCWHQNCGWLALVLQDNGTSLPQRNCIKCLVFAADSRLQEYAEDVIRLSSVHVA